MLGNQNGGHVRVFRTGVIVQVQLGQHYVMCPILRSRKPMFPFDANIMPHTTNNTMLSIRCPTPMLQIPHWSHVHVIFLVLFLGGVSWKCTSRRSISCGPALWIIKTGNGKTSKIGGRSTRALQAYGYRWWASSIPPDSGWFELYPGGWSRRSVSRDGDVERGREWVCVLSSLHGGLGRALTAAGLI